MPVDKSGSRVKQMFHEIAPRYDLMNHLLSLNIDRYWRRAAVQLVPPISGDQPILDLCTGTGDLAFAYQRMAKGAPVVAADFCREMLKYGEQKKRNRRLDGEITFVEADAQHLPFADNLFQIVCVAFGLRNVSDTDQGLSEMVRVCRPGGRVSVLEFSKPRVWPLSAIYSLYFRHLLPRVGQHLAKNNLSAYEYLPQSVAEFPDGERLAERMRRAGLCDVGFRPLTFGIATLYVGTKPGCQPQA